ncbi:MAG: CBS domain-containing protein [Candidatus Manganitrophaceae bacterium]|nr:MAG: CBS domain-containing protein [Candidatus Manganitrophaceae bacterium]
MRGTDYWVGGKTLWEMNASHMMERDVVCFKAETTCHDLAEAMIKGRFGGIPIVNDEKRLIGIVTEFDLLNALLAGIELKETTAQEVMSEPICITEEMTTEEIMTLFQSGHLIRVPVIDQKGCLVGMVTRRDMLAGYLESTLGPLPVF